MSSFLAPFLSSCRLCGIKVVEIVLAIKILLADDDDALMTSLMGKLENKPQLKGQLCDILMKGGLTSWQPDDEGQLLLRMYGLIVNDLSSVRVSNRIFEMWLWQSLCRR